ncbi:MAG TPA: DUF4388 domain-containing protein [Ktedonobacteraceae bacterium]|nr:DUF4388 domain-containing protein [Ktedonobacteraceae bacterium]
MPQPATSTDRLANVIQVIQLGRKTGTLTAERDSSSGLEHGIIFFVNGQVARARVQQLEGTAAFNRLNTWSACRFTFTPSTSSATTVKLPTVPSSHIADQTARPRDSNTMARPGTEDRAMNAGANQSPYAPGARVPFQHRALEEALQIIERANLSRAHRRLYLLIDGHRSSSELARLIGRSVSEIDALLQDLERAGVIRR